MQTIVTKVHRIDFIDFVKGCLIIFVIYGHIGCGETSMKIIKYIYMFHMPLFVFVSGFLFREKDSIESLWPSTKRLLRILIVFHILYVLFCYLTKSFVPQYPLLLIRPYQHLWYILSLVCWRYITQLIATRKKIGIVDITISLLLSLLLGFLPVNEEFCIAKTVIFMPYFLYGYYIKTGGYIKRLKNVKLSLSILALVAIWFISQNMPFYVDKFHGHYVEYIDIVYRLTYEIVGFVSIAALISILSNIYELRLIPIRVSSTIKSIGQDSLFYFVYHMVIIFVMYKFIGHFHLPKNEIFHMVYTILIVASCRAIGGGKIKMFRYLLN